MLAQALPLLAAPLLTRLYSPTDFGALALFASWLSMALAVATGRFDWSVPNARSTSLAAAVLALGALVLPVAGLLCAVALAATGQPGWYWLLLPALVGGGWQQLLVAWHVRGAELGGVGRAKVAQSVANVGLCVAAGPFVPAGQGAWALVAGVLLGAWAGLGSLWQAANDLQHALVALTRRRLVVAWRRFATEAGWSMLVSLLNAASFAAVPLLLSRHYSVAEVGFYALMQRIALGPVGLVGAAVSQSFWAEAARLVRADRPQLGRLYLTGTRNLGWVALPLALLGIAGPLYVGPLFGSEQWSAAGAVLAASVPMLVGQVVVSPLSHLVIHRLQRWQALWDMARLVLLALAIETAGRADAPLAVAVLMLSLVMAAMYAVLFALNWRALRG